MTPRRGEIWWGEEPDEGGRPYLVLTRDAAIGVLNRLLVAPVTRTIRGIPTQVPLGPREGLPTECVASFDNLQPFSKARLTHRMGSIDVARSAEVCAALRAAVDC
ncbi:MAG: type II toxin-antitoxin system PemK/MazF family toxin [Ilumatobacteraceae bacterium]